MDWHRSRFITRRLAILCLSFIAALLAGCTQANQASFDRTAALLEKRSSGILAFIASDGNIYLTTPTGTTVPVTTDATAAPERRGRSYHRVSWSPDGRLAYAAVERDLTGTSSELFVTDLSSRDSEKVGESDSDFVIYIHWSPAGERLAYLIEEGGGISLRIVEWPAGMSENQVIGTGMPHYFSWSPDGDSILAHTGGAQRYNPAAKLAMYHLDDQATRDLPYTPGLFLSPSWSPDGARWLGVIGTESHDLLQVLTGNDATTIDSAEENLIVSAWSPQGDAIAYAIRNQYDEPVFGPIMLFDLQTGETRQLTDSGFAIKAFFWSPDGHKLAYLTRLTLPDDYWMQWRTFDIGLGQDRGFASFRPSWQMQYMTNSFDQYAQSHRFWSADSRYLVFGDQDRALVERVWIVDTWNLEDRKPIPVAEGTMGVWSFHEEQGLVCQTLLHC